PSPRQSAFTALFSVSGLGSAQNAQRSMGSLTVPSGVTTSARYDTGSPDFASGGSPRTARILGPVTSDAGSPRSGRQPRSAQKSMYRERSLLIARPSRPGPPASGGL